MLSVINNLFIIMFLWGIFNFIMYIIKVRKAVRKHKDDPNIKGIKIVNGQVHIIENEKAIIEGQIQEETKELVVDPVCHAEVEKTKAYHLVKGGQSHYFCSWDCRENFLEPANEKHL